MFLGRSAALLLGCAGMPGCTHVTRPLGRIARVYGGFLVVIVALKPSRLKTFCALQFPHRSVQSTQKKNKQKTNLVHPPLCTVCLAFLLLALLVLPFLALAFALLVLSFVHCLTSFLRSLSPLCRVILGVDPHFAASPCPPPLRTTKPRPC